MEFCKRPRENVIYEKKGSESRTFGDCTKYSYIKTKKILKCIYLRISYIIKHGTRKVNLTTKLLLCLLSP